MNKYLLVLLPISLLLMSVGVNACIVSDDILWVGIESIDWETKSPTFEYNLVENTTHFIFIGNGTFNNPNDNDYRVVHRDGCGFIPSIEYSPDNSIENPLEGTDFFPFGCTDALMPIDYPKGKTNFDIYGGIKFPGNLTALPLGFYDISIQIFPPNDDEVVSINHLIQADGNVILMRMFDNCAPPPEETETPEKLILTGKINFLLFPSFVALGVIFQLNKSRR